MSTAASAIGGPSPRSLLSPRQYSSSGAATGSLTACTATDMRNFAIAESSADATSPLLGQLQTAMLLVDGHNNSSGEAKKTFITMPIVDDPRLVSGGALSGRCPTYGSKIRPPFATFRRFRAAERKRFGRSAAQRLVCLKMAFGGFLDDTYDEDADRSIDHALQWQPVNGLIADRASRRTAEENTPTPKKAKRAEADSNITKPPSLSAGVPNGEGGTSGKRTAEQRPRTPRRRTEHRDMRACQYEIPLEDEFLCKLTSRLSTQSRRCSTPVPGHAKVFCD